MLFNKYIPKISQSAVYDAKFFLAMFFIFIAFVIIIRWMAVQDD